MALSLRRNQRTGQLLLEVVVVPRSSREALLGETEGALRLAVTAPPVEGAANKAVRALIAKALGLPKSAVSVERGHKGRRKVIGVEGVDEAALQRLIEQ